MVGEVEDDEDDEDDLEGELSDDSLEDLVDESSDEDADADALIEDPKVRAASSPEVRRAIEKRLDDKELDDDLNYLDIDIEDDI